MTRIADEARQLWSASFYWRRAPNRDRSRAVEIIEYLATNGIPRIASLAQTMLKEIENEPTASND